MSPSQPPADAVSTRVLVIEDVPETQMLLKAAMRSEGWEVELVRTGEEGLDLVGSYAPHVVILDLMLPGIDGVETCRRLRAVSDAYVIMVTSRTEEVDRVVGLSVGADDYVTKPFSPRELIARVKAMMRRPRVIGGEELAADDVVEVGGLKIDRGTREVHLDGRLVDLTRIEFDLLDALGDAGRRVLTRQQLIHKVWGPNWVGDDHLLDVHVSKLRRKLDDDAREPDYVITVRGVGYRMGDGPANDAA